MQRYFLENPFDDSGKAMIEKEDRKHIVNVMRMKVNDELIAVSASEAYNAKIVEVTESTVIIQKVNGPLKDSELPLDVTIVCGLAKGDKHEWIVQKGTELGVNAIMLFKADRSIVKWNDKKGASKITRLEKIAKQAAEQSHRNSIPKIANPMTLQELVSVSQNYDILLIADEEEAENNSPHRLANRLKEIESGQKVIVVFGPEGGLSRNEVEKLQSTGFLPTSLGPRILRTETAPLYVLSAISCQFE